MIFLATFHKFLQFCLSNSVVSTTFGHFSQKSPLCRCGSYTHGSQRLMVSTEIIKNWGGKMGGGRKSFWGAFAPPWRRHCSRSSISTIGTLIFHSFGEYAKSNGTHAKDLGPQHSAFVARVVLCISLNY